MLLVSGAWTFDAVMVLGLVASVYYIQRGRVGRSALALAVGTMVSFIPAIAAPTLVLYLIKKRRPLREIALFLGVYAAACALFIGPFLGGLLYVLGFHGQRVGGGMNWEMFFRLGAFFPRMRGSIRWRWRWALSARRCSRLCCCWPTGMPSPLSGWA